MQIDAVELLLQVQDRNRQNNPTGKWLCDFVPYEGHFANCQHFGKAPLLPSFSWSSSKSWRQLNIHLPSTFGDDFPSDKDASAFRTANRSRCCWLLVGRCVGHGDANGTNWVQPRVASSHAVFLVIVLACKEGSTIKEIPCLRCLPCLHCCGQAWHNAWSRGPVCADWYFPLGAALNALHAWGCACKQGPLDIGLSAKVLVWAVSGLAVVSKMPVLSSCCRVWLPVESMKGSLALLAAKVLRESLNTLHRLPNWTAAQGESKASVASTHLLEEQELPPCRANMLCLPSLIIRGERQSIFACSWENAVKVLRCPVTQANPKAHQISSIIQKAVEQSSQCRWPCRLCNSHRSCWKSGENLENMKRFPRGAHRGLQATALFLFHKRYRASNTAASASSSKYPPARSLHCCGNSPVECAAMVGTGCTCCHCQHLFANAQFFEQNQGHWWSFPVVEVLNKSYSGEKWRKRWDTLIVRTLVYLRIWHWSSKKLKPPPSLGSSSKHKLKHKMRYNANLLTPMFSSPFWWSLLVNNPTKLLKKTPNAISKITKLLPSFQPSSHTKLYLPLGCPRKLAQLGINGVFHLPINGIYYIGVVSPQWS